MVISLLFLYNPVTPQEEIAGLFSMVWIFVLMVALVALFIVAAKLIKVVMTKTGDKKENKEQ